MRGNVADRALLDGLLSGVEEVYHLAAAVGVELIAADADPHDRNERRADRSLLAAVRRRHAAGQPLKLFLASSSEVYGKNPKPQWTEDDDLVFGPTTRARWSYGVSKAIDEFLVLACWRQERLPVVVGRLFNVVGPRQTGPLRDGVCRGSSPPRSPAGR